MVSGREMASNTAGRMGSHPHSGESDVLLRRRMADLVGPLASTSGISTSVPRSGGVRRPLLDPIDPDPDSVIHADRAR